MSGGRNGVRWCGVWLAVSALLAAAEARTGPADAPRTLFGGWAPHHVRALRLRGVDGSVRDGTLRIEAREPQPERSVVFPLSDRGLDLSASRCVEIELRNAGKLPLQFTFWAMSGLGWGGISTYPTGNPAGRETLAAGAAGVFRVDLHARYPGSEVYAPAINPASVRWLELVFENAERPLAVDIGEIRTAGTGLPVPPAVAERVLVPDPTHEPPAAGRRVYRQLPGWAGTAIAHVLTLPRDWQAGRRYPVLVEYPGSQFYHKFCYSTGRTADGHMAYGLARGANYLCLNLPFISEDGRREQIRGWGDIDRAVDYALDALADACEQFGGDRRAVVYLGFSRGGWAANYLALRDERIAAVWAGFVSFRDPGREWLGSGTGWNNVGVGWNERAGRMNRRPWFHVSPGLGSDVHADVEFLEDRPSTVQTRKWLADLLARRLPD